MKVVSTKLSEEEHAKLLDTCNGKGCTPSTMMRNAILSQMDTEEKEKPVKEKVRKISYEELSELVDSAIKERLAKT